jgi:hypothetical protein
MWIEWGSLFVAGFRRCTWTVSPTFTRMTGPGTCPPKVQTAWTKPSATVIVFSSTTRSTSWTVQPRSAGARGSRGTYGGAFGSACTSGDGAPPGSPPVFPLVAAPFTEIVPVMLASARPGTVHRKETPPAGMSTMPLPVRVGSAEIRVPSGKVTS